MKGVAVGGGTGKEICAHQEYGERSALLCSKGKAMEMAVTIDVGITVELRNGLEYLLLRGRLRKSALNAVYTRLKRKQSGRMLKGAAS